MLILFIHNVHQLKKLFSVANLKYYSICLSVCLSALLCVYIHPISVFLSAANSSFSLCLVTHTSTYDFDSKGFFFASDLCFCAGEPSLLWVDKYRPRAVKQIISQLGNKSNMSKLMNWLRDWEKNRKKSVSKCEYTCIWLSRCFSLKFPLLRQEIKRFRQTGKVSE